MTDEEIIKAIKNRQNDRAFGALYKGFPMIKKMIINHKGQEEDAEDVFQEALIILCTKIHQTDFKLTAQLSTYLYSVCRFLWNDELKRREKITLVSFDVEGDKKTDPIIDDSFERETKAKLAEQIINELGERCKELLHLFYSKSLKIKEIAQIMGYSSENTAKIQKYKCLEIAKRNLKELKQHHSVI